MARKPQVKEQQQSQNPFLNYTMTVQEQERFKKWRDEQTLETVNELCETLLDSHYGISIKFDAFNNCYAAYIKSPAENGQNSSVILTGRGRSAASSLLGALFRHYHVFEGSWPEQTITKRGTDDD